MGTKIEILLDNNVIVSSTVFDDSNLTPLEDISFSGSYTLLPDKNGVSIKINARYIRTVKYTPIKKWGK